MSTRHAGWFIYRLKTLVNSNFPASSEQTTTVRSYKAIPGLEKRLIKLLVALLNNNKGLTYRSKLSESSLLKNHDNCFIKPIISHKFNSYLIKNIYLTKLIAARSYKAVRMAKRRPVHGQRRWSNANTARRLNTFIYQAAKSYELDLFNYGQSRKFKWSYAWEMRQKAKLRKKAPKKKWTKFRKFGERRLAIKKKKKSPWD